MEKGFIVATVIVVFQGLLGFRVLKTLLQNSINNKINIGLVVLCLFSFVGYAVLLLTGDKLYSLKLVNELVIVSMGLNLTYAMITPIKLLVNKLKTKWLSGLMRAVNTGSLILLTLGYGFYYVYFIFKLITSGLFI